jgi:DNA-directed RNA polymerase subunit RPC12/RpoP
MAAEFVHFGCPRCTAALKARKRHAGKRQRCPLCYAVIVVPGESRPVREGYEVHADAAAPLPATAEIPFTCPVCHTRMTAPDSEVGREAPCPDCGTPSVVPPRAAAVPARPHSLADYALVLDYDPAAPPPPDVPQVRFHCKCCGTLMYAELTEVGRPIVCPDCGTATPAPPPPPPPEKTAADFLTAGEYAVADEPGSEAERAEARQPHVGFKCPACGTRLHAPAAQAGAEMACPDCGRKTTVPAPRPPPRRPSPPQAEPYDVGAVGPRPAFKPIFAPPWLRQRLHRGHEELTWEDFVPPPPPPPPRWPLLSGVFTLPWRGDCIVHWLGLTLGLATVIAVLAAMTGYGGTFVVGGGYGGIGAAIVALAATALAVGLGAMWAGVCAVCGLAIISDTAAGNDRIENWPDPLAFVDWVGSTFYVFNSLFLAAAPGMGAAWWLGAADPAAWLGVPVAFWLLFPPLLLSTLEAGSPLMPWSRFVMGSLLRCGWRWALFYAETALLLAGLVAVAALLPPWLALVVFAPAAPAAGMVYFRLLGRLAWWCS